MESENRERHLSTADIAGSAENREERRLKAENEAERKGEGVIPLGQPGTADAEAGGSTPSGNGHNEPITLFAPGAVRTIARAGLRCRRALSTSRGAPCSRRTNWSPR